MAPSKIIIDTDPGIDDILAMLLALSSRAEDLEVLLVSVTFGNIDVHSCLRNVVSLFHTVSKELEWRKKNGRPEGFEALKAKKPVVAVGPEAPLADQLMMADFFHGKDGLGGIHTTHPHLSPSHSWKGLFDVQLDEAVSPAAEASQELFTPSIKQAHKEILRILAAEPPNTVTIIAVGPLTNLALAAAEDLTTFLRAKEVVVMGGAINVPGNISPLAEFNTHADTLASAYVFSLTSPRPNSTTPPQPDTSRPTLPSPPDTLSDPLKLTLFPLDVTDDHVLHPEVYKAHSAEALKNGSPLAEWTAAFLPHAFTKSMEHGAKGLSVHDALCVWYAAAKAGAEPAEKESGMGAHETEEWGAGWRVRHGEDIRVETTGQWTRGACITDHRGRARKDELDVPGDRGGWFSKHKGNRLRRCIATPGSKAFEEQLLGRIFR